MGAISVCSGIATQAAGFNESTDCQSKGDHCQDIVQCSACRAGQQRQVGEVAENTGYQVEHHGPPCAFVAIMQELSVDCEALHEPWQEENHNGNDKERGSKASGGHQDDAHEPSREAKDQQRLPIFGTVDPPVRATHEFE